MSSRELVFAALASRCGEFVSGEELAASLGISRAAVWKAISSLREDGCDIRAATNRGYALFSSGDMLSAEAVSRQIPELGLDISCVKSVSSTNTVLKERAAAGASEGTVLIAAEQQSGRGRSGRSFFSPGGTGLYLSIILRPRLEASRAQLMTCLAAVAAAEAVERVSGEAVSIKWVNDLILRGRKIAGILTEASLDLETGGLDWAVLGIGFNLADPADGWCELEGIAGSIFGEKAPKGARARLAAEFLRSFWPLYRSFDTASALAEYKKRQAAIGKTVEVISLTRPPRKALAVDVDGDFRLIVRYPDGAEEALSSGEVRIIIEKGDEK